MGYAESDASLSAAWGADRPANAPRVPYGADSAALQAKAGDTYRKLCDLDETAWDRFSPQAIDELAQLIVDRVGACHARQGFSAPAFPSPAGGNSSGRPPSGESHPACLAREGIDDNLETLGDRTIGDILSIRAFGPRCLVDLLSALESPHCAARSMSSGVVNSRNRYRRK